MAEIACFNQVKCLLKIQASGASGKDASLVLRPLEHARAFQPGKGGLDLGVRLTVVAVEAHVLVGVAQDLAARGHDLSTSVLSVCCFVQIANLLPDRLQVSQFYL